MMSEDVPCRDERELLPDGMILLTRLRPLGHMAVQFCMLGKMETFPKYSSKLTPVA
jgi:hypothetical protein